MPQDRDPFEAVPPFHIARDGWVYDANGSKVLVCDMDYGDCPKLWAEDKVDSAARFMCPVCGRLGQRMEYATPERCGLETKGEE